MQNKRAPRNIRHARCALRGFTMIELVTVVVIVGVLAAMVAPRFFDRKLFASRGFHDQVLSTLRYAQKTAIAQNRKVCVAYTPTPGRLALSTTASTLCDTALSLPGGSVNYIEVPVGVAFSMAPTGINFDAMGRPSSAATASVDATVITVEAETGYVH